MGIPSKISATHSICCNSERIFSLNSFIMRIY
nr:MAG TPA: hypothetical protein [Caudoviricetes sp.]